MRKLHNVWSAIKGPDIYIKQFHREEKTAEQFIKNNYDRYPIKTTPELQVN